MLLMLVHGVLAPIADAIKKPRLAPGVGVANRVKHRQHRRQPDPAGDQHNRSADIHVETKIARRRPHIDQIPFAQVVERTRSEARRRVRLVTRRPAGA